MFDFNLDEVQEQSSVIPAGKYLAQVESVELKDSKSGGKYISAQFNVTDENQNGRKFWHLFNIANSNEMAVQIGLGQIKSLVVASGASLSRFTSPEQLIGLECAVNLGVKSDEYGDKNVAKSFTKPTELPADSELPKDANGNPIF